MTEASGEMATYTIVRIRKLESFPSSLHRHLSLYPSPVGLSSG